MIRGTLTALVVLALFAIAPIVQTKTEISTAPPVDPLAGVQIDVPTLLSGSGLKLFGAPRGCNGAVRAAIAGSDGSIYIGGDFTVCEDQVASRIARYDPASRKFAALGRDAVNGVNGTVHALAIVDGELIAGGIFTQAGGVPALRIARWNGTSWSAMGPTANPGADSSIMAATVIDRTLYVGGAFTQVGGIAANRIARWDGSNWISLGSGPSNGLNGAALALATNGQDLFVGGAFDRAGGQTANRVARWRDGSWSSVGTGTANGTDNTVTALATQGSVLYVGGGFRRAGAGVAERVARWNGANWSPLGTGSENGVDDNVSALHVVGSSLYVGGRFLSAGGITASRIAVWRTDRWEPLVDQGLNGVDEPVYALASLANGTLYVAGDFTRAGNAQAGYISEWSGSAWGSLGSGVGNGINGRINALSMFRDELIVAGRFTRAGSVIASNIARWNGSSWFQLRSGATEGVEGEVRSLVVVDGQLYAGGVFTRAGGIEARRVARWNGETWFALGNGQGNGLSGEVWALAGNGRDVFVGGEFTNAGNVLANRVARWDGSNWSSLGSSEANGADSTVLALGLSSTGRLYVGGLFQNAGGQSARHVATWDGSSWSGLGSGTDDWVNALTVIGEELYAGGYFRSAGGVVANRIARWNGSVWLPLASGVDDRNVDALLGVGQNLYAGGSFTSVSGQPANGLARWNGTVWEGLARIAPPQIVRSMATDGVSLFAGGAGLTQTPLPELVSATQDRAAANGESSQASLSRDGNALAFVSDASNLVSGDTNGRSDVFTRDARTGGTLRASAAAEAVNGGVAESFSDPTLSADGARLAYRGSTGQLYANVGGSARVLSRSAAGEPGNGASARPMLPGGGALAFFESQASNLLPGSDGNGAVSDIFVTDLASGVVTLVSSGPAGEPADGPSSAPWASQDGQTIAFSTLATNIVAGTAAAAPGLKAGTVQQATVMRGGGFGQSRFYVSRNLSTGELGNGHSTNVRLTADGRFGVFESLANNLVAGDTNNSADIFRFEISGNQVVRLERVSTSRYGEQANAASRNPSICDDGQYIAFESDASNLTELDRNEVADVMIKWLVSGQIERLSRTIDGNPPNAASANARISGDCTSLVFGSLASNLVTGDGNRLSDVFRVTTNQRAPTLVTGPQDEPSLSGYALPAPNPANASCPAGFFIAAVDDGPGSGLTPGAFGMELLLDEPGTRVLAGGLNFGGLIDAGQVGFAGFNFANAANEPQRLNLRVTGSPANDIAGSLPVRIRIARRTATTSETVFDQTTTIALTAPFGGGLNLPPAFYEATVEAIGGSVGGSPEGQFFFELTTSFVDRPGGGFQGGAVVGGYHATHPFGGVSGFAAFCLATPHSTTLRVLSRPSYGPSGAQDLRLKLRDAQQRELVVVPAG